MRKKLCTSICILSMTVCILAGCSSESSGLTKVTLNEVAHSVFYAPMYVAIEKGYFEEQGIQIHLVNGNGADKVMTALVAGEADIGFMGSEASIYVYQEGSQNYAVNFAQLTQRAGNFLVGREGDENFSWEDLKGKTVLGGRAGGMPEMIFEYILKQNGIDPENDLDIIQNIDFGVTAEAFASGTGDYTVEFEPFATSLEQSGNGYVLASLGVDSGYVPYTCFCALEDYIDQNPEIIQGFTNAIQKGLNYVSGHTPEEIAQVIAPQFEETDYDALVTIIQRYYEQDTWKTDTVFTEEAFNLLQDILDEAGQLTAPVDYETLVNTEFSQNAKDNH